MLDLYKLNLKYKKYMIIEIVNIYDKYADVDRNKNKEI